jgi:hypothetical protein
MSKDQILEQKQDDAVLERMLDQQRWLMNNGLINDIHKDQFYMYGAIVHKDIAAVELEIDVEKKNINYSLYADSAFLRKLDKFEELSKSTSLLGMWRFKRMLEKEGNLHLSAIIGRFIKDYCGPKWDSKVKMLNIKEYEDGYGEQENSGTDKQSNK